LLLFLVLMFMGIPVAHSMIITGYITLKFIHPEIPTIIVAQRLFGGMDNYILLCIPFFVLAGDLMSMTTLFDRLIRVANAMVGHIKRCPLPYYCYGRHVLCRNHGRRGGYLCGGHGADPAMIKQGTVRPMRRQSP